MSFDLLAAICESFEPLSGEIAAQLEAGVLCRIVKGDLKGRPFCLPGNPDPPTIAEFRPVLGIILAGNLAAAISGRKHAIFPPQAVQIQQMTSIELLNFRVDDPISGHAAVGGFYITGGHHRFHEIIRRV